MIKQIKEFYSNYFQSLSITGASQHFKKIYKTNWVLAISLIALLVLTLSVAVFMFFYMAIPSTLTIASGPPGSIFYKNAEKYKEILAKEGIKLIVLPSEGSIENLHKLQDKKTKVDVGFVLSGQAKEDVSNTGKLVSLGSISYQPLLVFYRGAKKTLLSDFKGRRIDIGQDGSGTHSIALSLLKENGIEPGGDTKLLEGISKNPVDALIHKQIDVLFVMGDSASTALIHELLYADDIKLYDFSQADGYTRRINYLHKLELPTGAIDFGKNIPSEDLLLIGPSVELIARNDLHPALSDALLEAVRQVHSTPSLFRKRGEFPSVMEYDLPISQDALRFYSSGKSFLYRNFPFWLASLINRTLAVVVPIGLLLIPGFRIIPGIYRWRIQSRIYPWYKILLEIEREAFNTQSDEKQIDELLKKIDHIEHSVDKLHIPSSYGDLYYGLKGHIGFVRNRLLSTQSTD